MTEAATGHGRERDSCPMLDPTVHTRIYIYTHTSRWKNRHLTPPRVKLCVPDVTWFPPLEFEGIDPFERARKIRGNETARLIRAADFEAGDRAMRKNSGVGRWRAISRLVGSGRIESERVEWQGWNSWRQL